MKKLLDLVGGLKGLMNSVVGGTGQSLASGTSQAITAAGGRKFFYGGWLLPIWILAAHLLGISETLILAGAGGIAMAIGWEGFRDLRKPQAPG